jgi:hypothetical protein
MLTLSHSSRAAILPVVFVALYLSPFSLEKLPQLFLAFHIASLMIHLPSRNFILTACHCW